LSDTPQIETPWRKKLIEVALPLDAINAESAREKSIRHGHPSTLHLWWARRPLAACRAVLFAQLVDDPSSHPDRFPTEADQDAERERLFGIIERMVKWENSTNAEVLEEARAEIRNCFPDGPPPILDPFAGGGSIPLEAQRLGLEAHASDLNPVAVLINKALIEIPPRWANQPPVHPDADNRTRWNGAEGLAEDVRRYSQWMREEAERRIGHLYPKATLPDGSTANVIAWIWARTVTCPNPACGATMPLASSFRLGKKRGKEAWIQPLVEGKHVRFSIGLGTEGPPDPPKLGRGAKFKCLVCGEAAPEQHIKKSGVDGLMGRVLMAVAAVGVRQRIYLSPEDSPRLPLVERPEIGSLSAVELSVNTRHSAPPLYGMVTAEDLYTERQLESLRTFASLVAEARTRIEQDSLAAADRPPDEYAAAVEVYLAMLVAKLADLNSSLVPWKVDAECPVHVFSQQVLPMTWDFAEANPFSDASGSWASITKNLIGGLLAIGPADCVETGVVQSSDARDVVRHLKGAVLSTDPPYYDNVPYADLADYFYPWLRLSLDTSKYADLFQTIASPKSLELVADAVRSGSKEQAEKYFERGFFDVFRDSAHSADAPAAIYYAFRQSEKVETGEVSTGWATMLEGLLSAGWSVNATWPIRTEGRSRMRSFDSNALASSVVLACRPRPDSAGVTDRQGLMRALQEELPGPLHELQKANIAPVDLRQAAIGPGMAVFSRFARVIEPDGSPMRVRTALGLINQVLDQVLGEQESAFDAETRWAIHWFSQFFDDEGPYGTAEQLAVSMNVAVSSMVESGILASGGGKVRLLGRDELPDDWDPTRDLRTPVWEATQHLVKRLESEGEQAASRLLRRLGGLGDSAQLLAYRLYTVCETTRPALAGPYNALVASWPEIQRLAREADAPFTLVEQQSFDA
jgi:putative DNA methylase